MDRREKWGSDRFLDQASQETYSLTETEEFTFPEPEAEGEGAVHTNAFLSGFYDFYQTQRFSDVVLILRDGTRLFAHKLILAYSSRFFLQLLQMKLGDDKTIASIIYDPQTKGNAKGDDQLKAPKLSPKASASQPLAQPQDMHQSKTSQSSSTDDLANTKQNSTEHIKPPKLEISKCSSQDKTNWKHLPRVPETLPLPDNTEDQTFQSSPKKRLKKNGSARSSDKRKEKHAHSESKPLPTSAKKNPLEGLNPKSVVVQMHVHDRRRVIPSIIEYMYKGEISLNIENCVAIMVMARCLQLGQLQKLAALFFRTRLQRETALKFLRQSVIHNMEDMKLLCINILARNFRYIFNDKCSSKAYEKIRPVDFYEIVSHENLQLNTEYCLFKAICRYLEAHDSEIETRWSLKLMSCVRFIWFEFDELKLMSDHKYVPRDQLIEALLLRLTFHEQKQETHSLESARNTIKQLKDGLCSTLEMTFNPIPLRLMPRSESDMEIEYSPTRADFFSGLLGWIGSNYGIQPFQNPHTAGKVKVHVSTLAKGTRATFVDQTPAETWTNNVPSSWVSIDFGPHRRITPNFYCLRHGTKWKSDALRNWELQGSVNDVEWVTISKHANDKSLNGPYAVGAFPLNKMSDKGLHSFRFLRIVQIGRNSSSNNFLAVSGIECYGSLHVDAKTS